MRWVLVAAAGIVIAAIALTLPASAGSNDAWKVVRQSSPSVVLFSGTEAQAEAFQSSMYDEGEGTIAYDDGPSVGTTTTTTTTHPTTTTTKVSPTTTTTKPVSKYCQKHPRTKRCR